MAGESAGPAPLAPGVGDKLMCSTHAKLRTLSCLQQVSTAANGTPIYACTPLHPCKVTVPGAVAAPVGVGFGDWGPEAIKRPAPWAMQVGPAVKRPRGAITWGVGAVGHMGHMGPVVPVGPVGPVGLPGTWGAMSPFGAGWEPDKALCVVHNKVRSVGSMAQSGIGQWVCRPDSQCKTGVPGADGVSVLQCAVHNRTRAANYLDLGPDGLYRCKPGRECKVSGKDA
eukprot:EG_transcript_24067